MTQNTYEMKPSRLSHGSSPLGADPQLQLRTALQTNDFATFKNLVSYGSVNLEHVYQYPDYKTCLELAVSEPNKQEFVKLLLQQEVEVNKVNETRAAAPIHFAVQKGNIEALAALLEDDRIDVNIKSKGNTALLMAIKKIEDLNDDREHDLAIYEEMVEMLLKAGSNANSPDLKGITPAYSAAKQGLERIVTLLLEYAKEPIHLDTYKDRRGRTARDYLKEAFPHLLAEFETEELEPEIIDADKLFSYLSRHEEDNFIRDFTKLVKKNDHRPALAANNGVNTMLQMATDKRLHRVVETLLKSGADPNATCSGNTPLQYAARNGDQETVLELLRNGACVGLRNKFTEPPLADINAKTLETYLDECITTNDERPIDDDYEIHVKYSFLTYQRKLNNEKELYSLLAPETDALLYMTRNEELRPLLKHPVITSFLYLKWQRISCLFYANLTFYSLLCLCLTLYIILGYVEEKKPPGSIEALNVVTHAGAVIGLILLIFRELFQLLLSPTRYLQSLDNWMEIILIFVTALIVSNDSAEESTKKQLSAVAILLSSAELVLLIGQFPALSTNIVILKTVLSNYFKFLLWYCILILAFALSFYTLFRHEDQDEEQKEPTNLGKEEEDEDFFANPGVSLFKTIIMLTGEFNAGSIKFSTNPVTSHLIFIVFIFMVPIVLFNLLNGLAISDTQEIRADAELVGHISRVKLLAYSESVLIGNARSYTRPSTCWSWLPISFEKLNIIKPKIFCIKPFAKRISLFPHFLPNCRIIVKPNQDNKIEIDYEDIEGGTGTCCFERCQNYRLDPTIVKNAKIVISKKTNVTEFDEIKDQLSKYEMKIYSLESTTKKVLQALEYRN